MYRSNVIEMNFASDNFPMDITTPAAVSGKTLFMLPSGAPDMETIYTLAMLNQVSSPLNPLVHEGPCTSNRFCRLQKADLAARGERCLTREELDAINNRNEVCVTAFSLILGAVVSHAMPLAASQREYHPNNCAKMNAKIHPYFNMAPYRITSRTAAGCYSYFSSRNNNFSNRDQTAKICVGSNRQVQSRVMLDMC